MKSLVLLSSLLVLTACSEHKTKRITQQVENNFDNSDNEKRLNDLDERVAALEAAVALNISQIELNNVMISDLEYDLSAEVLYFYNEISTIISSINAVKSDLEILQASDSSNTEAINEFSQNLSALEEELANTKALLNSAISSGSQELANVYAKINTLINTSTTLQGSVDDLLSRLVQLELQDSVIGIVDPCPLMTSSSFKEHLFKMKSGKLVAYFEDGGKRFLTLLTPGNYKTTDSRACSFFVGPNNTIIN